MTESTETDPFDGGARHGPTLPVKGASEWAGWLRSVAEPVLGRIDWSVPFADERGHRREIDVPLIAWARGVRLDPVPSGPASTDTALWHALASGVAAAKVDEILRVARAAARSPWGSDEGALLPQGNIALEVWTETELASLHALWWLARGHGRGDWGALIDGAVAWHLENIQPDNATAHPWGVHLFALRGAADAGGGARLHAETMLHNCQISLGRPDRLSALILMDAARAMEVAGGGGDR